MTPRKPVEERLRAKLERQSNGCLEWTGHRDKDGYGKIQITFAPYVSRPVGAHRVAWELVNGPIPDGLSVLHTCDNPPCCNPDHLFLGTTQDNVDDMMAKGRKAPQWQTLKTHCDSGHEFTPENTRTDANGWRTCRTCKGWGGIRTHCKNGHELAGQNLLVDHRGHRKCRTCHRAQMDRARNIRYKKEPRT